MSKALLTRVRISYSYRVREPGKLTLTRNSIIMNPEQNEIFFAIADVNEFMFAVEKANMKNGGVPVHLQKVLKSWITCYSVILSLYETPEMNEDAQAQALVDYTLDMLRIPKSP